MSAEEDKPPTSGGSFNTMHNISGSSEKDGEIPLVEYNEPSGGKNTAIGRAYQISLLTFYLLTAQNKLASFDFGTEMKVISTFKHVLRTRKEDSEGFVYHHLTKAKHLAFVITLDNLTTEIRGEICLRKCFQSFLKFRGRRSKCDEIGSLLIRARFEGRCLGDGDQLGDDDLRSDFEPTEKEDLIFGRNNLQFKKSFKCRDLLIDNLKKLNGCSFDEGDIEEFLAKLTFVMGIPDLEGLECLNRELFAKRTGIVYSCDDAYKVFKNELGEWAHGKKAFYLSHIAAKKMIDRLIYRYGGLSFELVDHVGNFVGRKSELEQIERAWEKGFNTVVISGLGGIGKTQLARKYIGDRRDRFRWAVNIRADRAKNEFSKLARILGVDLKGRDEKEIVEQVYLYFKPRQTVFLFENAETMSQEDVETYLPSVSRKPFIIITSRLHWRWRNDLNLSLKELTSCEAELFLRDNLTYKGQTCEDRSVKALAIKLENVPLVLQQSVNYINDCHAKSANFRESYCIEDFLEKLEEEEEACKILSIPLSGTNRLEYGINAVDAWSDTMEKIAETERGDMAINIIKLISYFNPKNIKVGDVEIYFEAGQREMVKEQLVLLKEFYVIDFKDNLININRLFQMIVRFKISKEGEVNKLMEWLLQFVDRIETKHASWLLVHLGVLKKIEHFMEVRNLE